MKKFKFRLEVVQKVRKIEMDLQAKILSEAMQKLATAKKKHEHIIELFQIELKRVSDLTKQGSFSPQMIKLSINYRDELKRETQRIRTEIGKCEAQVEFERSVLIEKDKKKRALEKLEEKERERYAEESRRAENRELDEIASTRYLLDS